jgi:exodeoxyribonuclease VII small subunit
MSPKKKDSTEASFEDSLKKLEKIVGRLEQGDVPLEEAIGLYEEGIGLSKVCAERLGRIELTLKRLEKDLEGNFELLDEETEQ